MKVKMAAVALLCSVAFMCSESNATDLLGRLLGRGGCGCEATPTCCESPAPACGCAEDTCGDSCVGTSGRLFGNCGGGLLSKLGGGCGCGPAPAVVPVVDETCGCGGSAVDTCGRKQPVRGLFGKLRGRLSGIGGGCGTDTCGCGPTPVQTPTCGCNAAPAECGPTCGGSDSCGCGMFKGGLLGRLTSRGGCDSCGTQSTDCGCSAPAPVVAPAPSCGCDNAPSCGCNRGGQVRGLLSKLRPGSGCNSCGAVEASDCGCSAPAPVVAPAPSCGCDNAPSCGCNRGGQVRGLLSKLRPGSGCNSCGAVETSDCGCSAPAPVVAPAPSCGCDNAPSCGCNRGGQVRGLLSKLRPGSGCNSCGAVEASDCGCSAPAASCGCDSAPSCGSNNSSRLKGRCNKCNRSSCGGCKGLSFFDRLRGDRTVRDGSNCGRCMPACPTADCGCNTCGNATTTSYGTVMESAPSMAPAAGAQSIVPAQQGTIVVPNGATRIQPSVDPSAFAIRRN